MRPARPASTSRSSHRSNRSRLCAGRTSVTRFGRAATILLFRHAIPRRAAPVCGQVSLRTVIRDQCAARWYPIRPDEQKTNRRRLPLNAVFLEFAIERGAADAQQFGRFGHVVAGPPERFLDQLAFPEVDPQLSKSTSVPVSRRPRSLASMTSPSAITTALSITLRNCRTFPGQS